MQYEVHSDSKTRRDERRRIQRAPTLAEQYCATRAVTERLAERLSPDEQSVQSMADASPTKWHLGHTSWFFERVVLKAAAPAYEELNKDYDFIFNSYYESFGARLCRGKRGLVSRPTVAEVLDYRRHVDANVLALLCGDAPVAPRTVEHLVIGLHHEQQHQELILTDIKHALATSPLRPRYLPESHDGLMPLPHTAAAPLRWLSYPTTIASIGSAGDGFAFDNELPRHPALVPAFELASRPVTAGELMRFIEDGGYERPELWLSEGWAAVQAQGWRAPLYWERADGRFWHMTLAGMRPVTEAEPACHVSFFEADAYARWAGARLPTEEEWEVAAAGVPVTGNFVESGALHPLPLAANEDGEPRSAPRQLFGDVWEWTSSPYLAYPGFRPWSGALAEYNAKFMCNQFVLRGGSCATPRSHVRPTYRNYFPPSARWQFSGFRLAR